jgi:hypothetical protein
MVLHENSLANDTTSRPPMTQDRRALLYLISGQQPQRPGVPATLSADCPVKDAGQRFFRCVTQA